MAKPSPFDLSQAQAYADWRCAKLASQPQCLEDLMVDVADPQHLSPGERAALLQRCERHNMAVYRSTIPQQEKSLPIRLGEQLGLRRLDANWLADDDGVSSVQLAPPGGTDGVSRDRSASRQDYIPYTDQALSWHTDGYYHPPQRRIQGMILHCVRAAGQGGENGLIDHERLYIEVRDTNPEWVRALMAADAMTIPARADEDGVARAAQSGPVFSPRADGRGLHMRYTSRTRSILWKPDKATTEASAFIRDCLDRKPSWLFQVRLQPGMGIVANNVLHARSRFTDDEQKPRLIYRARYLDHVMVVPRALRQEQMA